MNQKLNDLVLSTLSFYEPMTFSRIILDFDNKELENFPEFAKEDLQDILTSLSKKKFIKRVRLDKEDAWIRVLPKRSWWKFFSI